VDGTDREGEAMVVGEERGLPEASARRLVRIDIQAVTLGRGSETSWGMMLYSGLSIV
jgi:hypothetical protein